MNFDARPLIDPVNPAALQSFIAADKASGNNTGQTVAAAVAATIGVGVLVGGVAIIAPTLIFIITFAIGSLTSYDVGATVGIGVGVWGTIALGILLAGIAVLAVTSIRRYRRSMQLRAFRLANFASANGMQYLRNIQAPALPGMIFSAGSDPKTKDAVRGLAPRFVCRLLLRQPS